MSAAEAITVTLEVARVFERLGIPYMVGGSLASSLHGVPRATLDTDVVADLHSGQVDAIVTLFRPAFYVDEERVAQAVDRRASFNVVHLATMFKVDIFVLGDDAASRMEMTRRESYQIGDDPGDTAYVASAEDTVLQKLVWYRLGRGVSDRQWGDLIGVLRVQRGRLDGEYLREMAQELGVLDLLEEALEEASSASS